MIGYFAGWAAASAGKSGMVGALSDPDGVDGAVGADGAAGDSTVGIAEGAGSCGLLASFIWSSNWLKTSFKGASGALSATGGGVVGAIGWGAVS